MGTRTPISPNATYAGHDEHVLDSHSVSYYLEGTRDRHIMEDSFSGMSVQDVARKYHIEQYRVREVQNLAITRTRLRCKSRNENELARKTVIEFESSRRESLREKLKIVADEMGFDAKSGVRAANVMERCGVHEISEIRSVPLEKYKSARGCGKQAYAIIASVYGG